MEYELPKKHVSFSRPGMLTPEQIRAKKLLIEKSAGLEKTGR